MKKHVFEEIYYALNGMTPEKKISKILEKANALFDDGKLCVEDVPVILDFVQKLTVFQGKRIEREGLSANVALMVKRDIEAQKDRFLGKIRDMCLFLESEVHLRFPDTFYRYKSGDEFRGKKIIRNIENGVIPTKNEVFRRQLEKIKTKRQKIMENGYDKEKFGEPYKKRGLYYVTARKDTKTFFLAGPFCDHISALQAIPEITSLLRESPDFPWVRFGTSRPETYQGEGLMNADIKNEKFIPTGTSFVLENPVGICDCGVMENDPDGEEVERQAKAGEIGTVVSSEPEKDLYLVAFAPSEVCVYLSRQEIWQQMKPVGETGQEQKNQQIDEPGM